MAGSYPDAPGRRMAWDADGTIAWYAKTANVTADWQNLPAQNITEYSSADKQDLNTEYPTFNDIIAANGPGSDTHGWIAMIFPEPRDIYGVYFYATGPGNVVYGETSSNTTNGIDGSWTTYRATWPTSGSYFTSWTQEWSGALGYRVQILEPDSTVATAQRSFRIIWTCGYGLTTPTVHMKEWHIYGEIAAGYTTDRLLYIDNSTGLEYATPIDWGDTPRGTTYDEDWYIKNNSSTLTANNTNVTIGGLYGGSDSWHTLSTGVGFSTGLGPISTIGPSSRWPASNPLTVRLAVPSTGSFSAHAARIVMDTSSWS